MFQFSPFVVPYFGSGIVTAGVAAYTYRYHRKYGSDETVLSLAVMMLSATIWILSRSFQYVVTDETLKVLLASIVWIGWGGGVMGLLFFTLAYTGRTDVFARRTVGILLVPVVIGILLALTNELHTLLWTGEFVSRNGLYVYVTEPEPAHLLSLLYLDAVVVYSVVLLVKHSFDSAKLYRRQTIAIVLGAITPMTLGALFLFNLIPFVPDFLDLTPIGIGVTGLCFSYAIFRYRMLDLVPIARRTAWDEVDDAIVTLDGDNRVLDANVAARNLFIDDGDDYVGMQGSAFFDSVPDEVLERYEDTAEVETQIAVQLDGEERYFSLSLSPIDRGSNTRGGRVVVLRDITGIKRREEELDLLRQVQSRVLRHNIRNELTSIRGHTNHVAEAVEDGHAERLQTVLEASDDLLSISRKARLVEDVVDGDGKPAEYDLRDVVDETIESMENRYPNVSFDVNGPNSRPVEADTRLEVVIENLLENAAEHNDATSPCVSVRLTNDETPTLTITDNGSGIPEYELTVLEDERETSLEHGSGIGLWLVKWIVDRSSATLEFQTNSDGTEATLRFG
ncbi:histidine kinase N-terminal 7TM domain-containing protein [Natrinema halophilum]|uniref:PAS domain-containing protein n=1 Tax=Natrinema halophilum TaxID=1699371 RepID=A0A7D5GGK5_9EURY|nr:histidine kinase N-terminal 7TM domain-containing protein [Natrinema halophilum]QLG48368.1 ATP-binding protein [Natrinema halophilum]